MAADLSPAKVILLAVHYASQANLKPLSSLTALRHADFTPELVLRILLTYLPESVEPREYVAYVGQVASGTAVNEEEEDVQIDTSPVKGLGEEQARKKVAKSKLLALNAPTYPSDAPDDILTTFICHRAYRIDSATGLLNLLPQLIEPFLEHNEYLRCWYIGNILPLLRLQFEYYPDHQLRNISLTEFERLGGNESVEFLMSNAAQPERDERTEVARDIKGLVGPWMYGHSGSKRRKLNIQTDQNNGAAKADLVNGSAMDTNGAHDAMIGQEWEYMYQWMVSESRNNFSVVTHAINAWDGPHDVDLGPLHAAASSSFTPQDSEIKLQAQYAQAAFAACYTVESDTVEVVREAYSVLGRLATILGFSPPPELERSMDSLSKLKKETIALSHSRTASDLSVDALLRPGNPLTSPNLESYTFLHMIITSAYLLSQLKYPISLRNVVKLHSFAMAEEQLAVLQRILRSISSGSGRRDEAVWTTDREKLMWLWSWDIESAVKQQDAGAGVLGKIRKRDFEEEILKSLIDTSCYDLAIGFYLKASTSPLPRERIEQIVLDKTMEAYDGATNGNRTRGGMKKANDIVSAFRSHFSSGARFREAASLIAATHALSFYSLTLQHGVPFQPVSIRVSHDPIGLIGKVLEQNPGSYTKLDDLVGIGQNLITAGLPQPNENDTNLHDSSGIETKRRAAERRVTFMAVEAALQEDDFETAYSYIINRLTPSSADITASRDTKYESKHARNASKSSAHSEAAESEDDTSWRAAFLAGRFRPAAASPPSLRRLEQRTELLSLALLLAPVSALTEILAAWRRCEEETTSLQLSQQQADEEHDDRADKRQSTSSIPGNFTVQGEQPALMYNQKRREMGRMTGKAGGDEAPVSMFDLTRSAAQALSKNAFPLRGATRSSMDDPSGLDRSVDSFESDGGATDTQRRVRKRDMVTNAVSGGLASGLGWVLGATPVSQQQTRDDSP